ERAGIEPDIVTLSKSIAGGLPMAVVLLKPELDQWQRGEDAATFRGNNLAFVTATEALGYWETEKLAAEGRRKGAGGEARPRQMRDRYPALDAVVRGIGLIWGLDVRRREVARAISAEAFARGLVIELSGPTDSVLKVLPPLVIPDDVLDEGLARLDAAIASVVQDGRVFGAAQAEEPLAR